MDFNDVLEAAKAGARAESDSALARALRSPRQSMSNWRRGRNLPDAITCEKLALLSGIPLIRIIEIIGEQRAISAAEKRVWRKLTTTAALALAVGFSALPGKLNAADNMHYTKLGELARFLSRQLRRILFGQKLLKIQHKSPALLAA
jgi:hypothetical protein